MTDTVPFHVAEQKLHISLIKLPTFLMEKGSQSLKKCEKSQYHALLCKERHNSLIVTVVAIRAFCKMPIAVARILITLYPIA